MVLTIKKPGAAQPLPAGSYRASCRSCSVDLNGGLSCICDDMEGSTVSASMNTCECDSEADILNCNGELSCGRCQAPPGSYLESCNDCIARVGRLTCGTCERIDGTANNRPGLSLPCAGDIINCDGVLRCGGC